MSLLGSRWSFGLSRRSANAFIKNAMLFLVAVGTGIALGRSMLTPAGEIVFSVIGILVFFAVAASNPLHGMLLWIVTQPLAYRVINISLGAGIPDLSPTRFCVAFVTILVLARASVGRVKLVRFTKIDVVAALFVFGIVLSAPNAADGWRSLQTIFDRHIVAIVVYFLAKNLVKSKVQLRKVVLACWILTTYVGLYAIYEQTTGTPLFAIEEGVRVNYIGGLRILRGLLTSPTAFGRVLGIGLPFTFYLFLEEKRLPRRILYFLSLGVIFVGIYFTYNRTSWIAAIASLFLIQWFYPRLRNVFLVLLVITFAALYINRDQLRDSDVAARTQAGEMTTLHGRTVGWSFAVELWKKQPLFGYGYGRFREIAQQARTDSALESQYLHILVSSGLVGFLPYVLLFLLIPLSFVKTYRSRDGPVDRWLIVAYWGAQLSYLVNASTTTDGRIVTSSLLFLLAGALSGRQAHVLEESEEPTIVAQAALSKTV
jgi:O-antigen ligase